MHVYQEIEHIRKIRNADPSKSWGLVPTMGALHDGHRSLVRQARQENDCVGVSIFVNPIQFNNSDDLRRYPRTLKRDLALLETEGVDLVWTPTEAMMYPAHFQTHVAVEKMTQVLEGAVRPGHFQGVTTVVAKLFNVFQPQRAYFGQKDFQQLAVIRRMAVDLNFPIDIVACPTIRESDGLAMSSRNVNLSPDGRKQSVCLFQALSQASQTIVQGERNAEKIRTTMTHVILSNDRARIDYVSVAHPVTLAELQTIDDRALLSLAVFVDGVRLIDNVEVEI